MVVYIMYYKLLMIFLVLLIYEMSLKGRFILLSYFRFIL